MSALLCFGSTKGPLLERANRNERTDGLIQRLIVYRFGCRIFGTIGMARGSSGRDDCNMFRAGCSLAAAAGMPNRGPFPEMAGWKHLVWHRCNRFLFVSIQCGESAEPKQNIYVLNRLFCVTLPGASKCAPSGGSSYGILHTRQSGSGHTLW